MKLIYTPKEGDPQEWEVDANRLTIGEAKKLEQVLGQTMGEIGELLGRGSFTAMIALLWVFRRREEPDLRYGDMDDIGVDELVTEDDEPEVEAPKEPDDDEPAAA